MSEKLGDDLAIVRPAEHKPASRGNGVSSIALITPASGAKHLINGFTTFEPGCSVAEHWHNCEESILILEGEGVVVVGDKETPVRAGDTTWLPPNLPHYFKNTSRNQPLKIFWTYASETATRTIASTGIEAPIAAEHKIAR